MSSSSSSTILDFFFSKFSTLLLLFLKLYNSPIYSRIKYEDSSYILI